MEVLLRQEYRNETNLAYLSVKMVANISRLCFENFVRMRQNRFALTLRVSLEKKMESHSTIMKDLLT